MAGVTVHEVKMEGPFFEFLFRGPGRVSGLFGHARPRGFVLAVEMTGRAGLHAGAVQVVSHRVFRGPSLRNLVPEAFGRCFPHKAVTVGALKARLDVGVRFGGVDRPGLPGIAVLMAVQAVFQTDILSNHVPLETAVG